MYTCLMIFFDLCFKIFYMQKRQQQRREAVGLLRRGKPLISVSNRLCLRSWPRLVSFVLSLCFAMQYTTLHCNILQHTVKHCNNDCPCLLSWPRLVFFVLSLCFALQHTATHCNTLQHSATHCNNDYPCSWF